MKKTKIIEGIIYSEPCTVNKAHLVSFIQNMDDSFFREFRINSITNEDRHELRSTKDINKMPAVVGYHIEFTI